MVIRAELIKPFAPPHFRIDRDGRECDDSDLRLLTDGLRSGRVEILAADLLGHPPYTHVVRYHYADGATDFLAQIDTAGYLVHYDGDETSTPDHHVESAS
jgi:hypothetical protein